MSDFQATTKYATFDSALVLTGDFDITAKVILRDLSVGYILDGVNFWRINSSTQMRFNIGGSIYTETLDATLVEGNYYTFRIARTSGIVTIYVNGVAQSATISDSGSFSPSNIGGNGNDGVGLIESVLLSGVSKWSSQGGWKDEIGANNTTLTGSPETIRVPQITTSQQLTNPPGS